MNWQAFILAFFLTINVSAEACAAPVMVGDKDQPHALCIMDDAEQGQGFSPAVHEDDLALTDVWNTVTEVAACKPAMLLLMANSAMWQERSGVRLHRRLCVERC